MCVCGGEGAERGGRFFTRASSQSTEYSLRVRLAEMADGQPLPDWHMFVSAGLQFLYVVWPLVYC